MSYDQGDMVVVADSRGMRPRPSRGDQGSDSDYALFGMARRRKESKCGDTMSSLCLSDCTGDTRTLSGFLTEANLLAARQT